MPSRTARLSKKGCGFATPECRAQRDVAVPPGPAPPPPLLAAPRLSTTALGDLEIRWVVSGDVAGLLTRFAELQAKARARTGQLFPLIVIQEAGLDGFWLHRVLQNTGI